MSHYVIGDIHGCYDELVNLVGQLELKDDDKVIFVGDFLDKGPSPNAVVDFVRGLPNVQAVMGNHEAKYVTLAKKGKNPDNISEDNLRWLEDLPNYLVLDFPGVHKNKVTILHAGIFPAFYTNHKPVSEGYEEDPRNGFPTKKWRYRVDRFRFCRYVNPEGNVVAFGSEKPEDVYWAKTYKGQDGLVIYGHQHWENPNQGFMGDTLISLGIDTGCVYGGKLTAVRLEDMYFYFQPANQRYAAPLIEE